MGSWEEPLTTVPHTCFLSQDPDDHVRTRCRRTCDERLNSAAANSHLPSSISSPTGPALDYLLQLRDAQDQQRTFASFQKHGKDGLQAEAPRRLPPLIKLLTGFGSNVGEHGRPSNKVIATREKPPFDVPSISGNKPTEEELLRSVAVSAATAVWSKSRTLFGNNRMSRVNLEWDEALRWIAVAGWDRRRTIQSSLEFGSRRRENESPTGEGLEHFVEDLEKLLETCLSTCLDGDVNFGGNLAGPEDSVIATSSTGTTVLKSVVGWFIGAATPTASPEASRMTTRMLMIATWSVAAYAINSSLPWLSPILANWYSTVRRKENPDWLLDHERESQAVRKMKSKHRKKKRRQYAHRSGKAIAGEGEPKPQTQTFSVDDRKGTAFQIRQQCNENKSSSSGSLSSSSVDAVPSVISCSTEPSDSFTNYSSSPIQCSPSRYQRNAQNLLTLTPSQELNGEASQQLKEGASIQRDIDRQKLEAVVQDDSIFPVPETNNQEATATFPRPKKDPLPSIDPPLPQCTSSSCQLPVPTAQMVPEPSLNLNEIVKPPPGFGFLAPTAEFDAVEEDKRMEERLGSLLDDEFENDDIDALLHAGMESLSAEESTLNPSAAPFVSKPGLASLPPGPGEEKKGWKTEQGSLVSPTKIAGVYGGSVW